MPKPPARGQRVKPIRPVKDPSKLRISEQLKTAITLMITQGKTRAQAAEAAGLKDQSLYYALCKPHVVDYKNRVLREFRESLAEKSLVRVDLLADTAKNDSTKLQANKLLIEQDERFTPTVKNIHQGTVEYKITPGYVIDLSEPDSEHLLPQQVIDAKFDVIDQ